jgi:hypothetical protein
VVDRKRKEAPPKTFHHNVYVILLEPAVPRHPSIVRLNLNRDPAKPCVYVGMTGLTVEDRFRNHKTGHKSAWEKYGLRLMPEQYEYFKSDALRGSGPDGRGFGRRSAERGSYCNRRHLGRLHILRVLAFLFLAQAVFAWQPTPILPDPKPAPSDAFDVAAEDVRVPGCAKKVLAVGQLLFSWR